MEFCSQESSFLILKIASNDPKEHASVTESLPVLRSHYDKKRGVLMLLFAADNIDSLLMSFMELFPEIEILETGLTTGEQVFGYVKKFSDNLSIVSPGPGITPREGQIIIRSSLAFGSGFHPTTELSIRLLEHAFSIRRPKKVFDLGTGSGILALAAAKLGAELILAADIDFGACIEARENVLTNAFQDTICVVRGSYSCGKEGGFDLLLANLTISTIVKLAGFFAPLLAPYGLAVISGFMKEQSHQVVSALGGCEVLSELDLEGWGGLLVRPD